MVESHCENPMPACIYIYIYIYTLLGSAIINRGWTGNRIYWTNILVDLKYNSL
jgi:hypothetical protein